MNLFVIGNGFDIAHGLATSYKDFRGYLEEQDWAYLERFESFYGFSTDSDKEFVEGALWKEFEIKLSTFDEEDIVDQGSSIDLGLDGGDIAIEDTLIDHWKKQYGYIKKLNDHVRQWIEQIDINIPTKTKIINSKHDDLYFTFNYTLLLEKIYHIDDGNILHVHGSIGEKDYPPIIGHGDSDKVEAARNNAMRARNELREKESSIYSAIADYYEHTLKNVNLHISINKGFFNRLSNVDKIFVIGSSLGDSDMPYFQEIKSSTKEGTIWNIYYYDALDEIAFLNKIASLGVGKENIHMIPSEEFF